MSKIEFKCKCGHLIKVSADRAGQTGKCKNCNSKIAVPADDLLAEELIEEILDPWEIEDRDQYEYDDNSDVLLSKGDSENKKHWLRMKFSRFWALRLLVNFGYAIVSMFLFASLISLLVAFTSPNLAGTAFLFAGSILFFIFGVLFCCWVELIDCFLQIEKNTRHETI